MPELPTCVGERVRFCGSVCVYDVDGRGDVGGISKAVCDVDLNIDGDLNIDMYASRSIGSFDVHVGERYGSESAVDEDTGDKVVSTVGRRNVRPGFNIDFKRDVGFKGDIVVCACGLKPSVLVAEPLI